MRKAVEKETVSTARWSLDVDTDMFMVQDEPTFQRGLYMHVSAESRCPQLHQIDENQTDTNIRSRPVMTALHALSLIHI